MRNANRGAELPPVEVADPFILETNEEWLWLQYDDAVESFDDPADRRAKALAEAA